MAWVQYWLRFGRGVETVHHPNLLLEGVWGGVRLYTSAEEHVGETVALKDTIVVAVGMVAMVVEETEKCVVTKQMEMKALAEFLEKPNVPVKFHKKELFQGQLKKERTMSILLLSCSTLG